MGSEYLPKEAFERAESKGKATSIKAWFCQQEYPAPAIEHQQSRHLHENGGKLQIIAVASKTGWVQ